MKQLLTFLIRAYQLVLSPFLGPSCRFHPTCSAYALTCLDDHGIVKGLFLTLRRIARCHPFGGSGYDPPPPATPLSTSLIGRRPPISPAAGVAHCGACSNTAVFSARSSLAPGQRANLTGGFPAEVSRSDQWSAATPGVSLGARGER